MVLKEFVYFCMALIIVSLPMNYIASKNNWSSKLWKIPQGKKPGLARLLIWLVVATLLQLVLKTLIHDFTGDPSLGQLGAGIALGLTVPFIPGIQFKSKSK